MRETPLRTKVPHAAPGAAADLSVPHVLTGDETVDEVVERHPALRTTMTSYGLCTCCSGGLTLRQNAEARGLPLPAILADLEQELAKGA